MNSLRHAWRSVWSRFSRRQYKGVDPFGNAYYEEMGVHAGRPRRTVVAPGGKPAEQSAPRMYQSDRIPVQWRAWLSHTRVDAPTLQEIEEDLRARRAVRERGLLLEQQWQARKQELLQNEQYQLMVESIRQETSAEPVDFEEMLKNRKVAVVHPTQVSPSSLPQGQADTFQPGQWQPINSATNATDAANTPKDDQEKNIR